MSHRLLTLFTMMLITSCAPVPAQPPQSPPAAKEAALSLKQAQVTKVAEVPKAPPTGVEKLLRSVPEGNPMLLIPNIARAVRSATDAAEMVLSHPARAGVVRMLTYMLSTRQPLSLSWLQTCGLEQQGMAMVGASRRHGVFWAIDLKDFAEFRKCTKRWAHRGWSQLDDSSDWRVSGRGRFYCRFSAGRLTCLQKYAYRRIRKPKPGKVFELDAFFAGKQYPKRTVWDNLSPRERTALPSSSAFLSVPTIYGFPVARLMLKPERDGFSVAGTIDAAPIRRRSPLAILTPAPARLGGLVNKHGGAYLNWPSLVRALAVELMREADGGRRRKPYRRIATTFTGEVALVGGEHGAAGVVGMDPEDARELLVKLQSALAPYAKANNLVKPILHLKSHLNRLTVTVSPRLANGKVAFTHVIEVAAGPAGLWVGQPKALAQHVGYVPATPTSARSRHLFMLKGPVSPPGAAVRVFLLRLATTLHMNKFERQVFQLIGYALEQTDRIDAELTTTPRQTAAVALRLTTLHRDGIAADDKARSLFRSGAGAEPAKRAAIVRRLAKEFPNTRYAKLAARTKLATISDAVGSLAAFMSLPTLGKQVLRQLTVEATKNLRRIAKGAHKYFRKKQTFPTGTKEWTPPQNCCKKRKGKCSPRAGKWRKPPWKALKFRPRKSHRYQYRFSGSGKGRKARYIIEARGDLDCDNVFSKYKMIGSISHDNSTVRKGPIIWDELE